MRTLQGVNAVPRLPQTVDSLAGRGLAMVQPSGQSISHSTKKGESLRLSFFVEGRTEQGVSFEDGSPALVFSRSGRMERHRIRVWSCNLGANPWATARSDWCISPRLSEARGVDQTVWAWPGKVRNGLSWSPPEYV